MIIVTICVILYWKLICIIPLAAADLTQSRQ